MKAGCGGVELEKPALREGTEPAKHENVVEHVATGHLPDAVRRTRWEEMRRHEGVVRRPRPNEGEIDGDVSGVATTPATPSGQMRGGGEVPEITVADAVGERAPPDVLAALQLGHGQEHALTEELPQRALNAVPADQSLEVPILAARTPQEWVVGTRRPRVDRRLNEREEGGCPRLEPPPNALARLLNRNGLSQERWEAVEKSGPGEDLLDRDHGPLLLPVTGGLARLIIHDQRRENNPNLPAS